MDSNLGVLDRRAWLFTRWVSIFFPLGSTYLGMTGRRRVPWHVLYCIAARRRKEDSVHMVEARCAVMLV